MSSRKFKKEIRLILGNGDVSRGLERLERMPFRQVVNPLFSFLLSTEPQIRWAAVSAFGAVVSKKADQDVESARVIVRRLMWQLNDESGGIGWGCPETLGEILACHDGLAKEYAQVLISYVKEEGNFLEYEPLREGAVWGIGRVAEVRPGLMTDAIPCLLPSLLSKKAEMKALTVRALGLLGAREAREAIAALANDNDPVNLYLNRQLKVFRLGDLARTALERIEGNKAPGF